MQSKYLYLELLYESRDYVCMSSLVHWVHKPVCLLPVLGLGVVGSVSSPSDETKNRGPVRYRLARVKDLTIARGETPVAVAKLFGSFGNAGIHL